MPQDLTEPYLDAWRRVAPLSAPLLDLQWDDFVAPTMFTALAVSKGKHNLGALALDGQLTCPSCNETHDLSEFELGL